MASGSRDAASSAVAPAIASYFWRQVCERSDATAFVRCHSGGQQLYSWRDLGTAALRLIELLRPVLAEAEPKHVASWLPNSLEWILLDVAIQTLGGVHVAIDARLPEPEGRLLLGRSRASHCFIESPRARGSDSTLRFHWLEVASGRVASCSLDEGAARWSDLNTTRAATQQLDSAAPAMLLFTSGSSGESKGVVLSHRNLVSNALAKLDAAPQSSDDLRLNILPFSHAYARTCELSTWIVTGGRLAIAANWRDVVLQTQRLHPSLLNLVPYLAAKSADLLRRDRRALGGRMRLLQVGGAALDQELWWELSELGLPPLQGYGLTEASPVVCSNRAADPRPGSVGHPVQGVDIRLDAQGILWCRGPNVMLGYWEDTAASRAVCCDGWLCTGDLAEELEDGRIRILGRSSSQVVLSTGYKFSPEPIEAALASLDWIQRAIVIGSRRSYPVALVWPTQQFTPAERRECFQRFAEWLQCSAERLPAYVLPRKIAIIETGPIPEDLQTAKGSLRRTLVEQHYRVEIDRLYGDQ